MNIPTVAAIPAVTNTPARLLSLARKLFGRATPAKSEPQQRNRARGEGHGLAKLTADAVRSIRVSTERNTDLARRLNVSETAIRKVRNGATWGHVL